VRRFFRGSGGRERGELPEEKKREERFFFEEQGRRKY